MSPSQSHDERVEVQLREQVGTRNARRLRAAGKIPAVLYGHGEKTVNLQLSAEDIEAVIRHGSHVVQLRGAETGSALIREIHWGPLGSEVLHLDFARVDKGELVELTVPVETRGVAPGTREGGVLQQPLHEIELRCPVSSVPEYVEVNINNLELHQQISVRELELPPGAEAVGDPDMVVVQVVEAAPLPEEEEELAAESVEPELIRREEEEQQEGGEET